MSFAATHCRRIWRKAVLVYRYLCARDDAVAYGYSVPSGVWVCRWCDQTILEFSALRDHVCLEPA